MNLCQIAGTIFEYALTHCSVESAFAEKFLSSPDGKPNNYTVRGSEGEPLAEVDLTGLARVIVIAAGKGAATMLQGLPATSIVPERPLDYPTESNNSPAAILYRMPSRSPRRMQRSHSSSKQRNNQSGLLHSDSS